MQSQEILKKMYTYIYDSAYDGLIKVAIEKSNIASSNLPNSLNATPRKQWNEYIPL